MTMRVSFKNRAARQEKNFYTSYSKLSEVRLVTIGYATSFCIKKWAEKTLPNGKILGEVLNANTLHYKTFKPQKGGLFCERIFGPLKDFQCACGKPLKYKKTILSPLVGGVNPTPSFGPIGDGENGVKGERAAEPTGAVLTEGGNNPPKPKSNAVSPTETGGETLPAQTETTTMDSIFGNLGFHAKKRDFCEICDVEYTWSVIRRYQLGYIKLVSPIIHIWYLKGMPSYLSILLQMKRRALESIIYCSKTPTIEYALKGPPVVLDSAHIISTWQKLKTQIVQSSKGGSVQPQNQMNNANEDFSFVNRSLINSKQQMEFNWSHRRWGTGGRGESITSPSPFLPLFTPSYDGAPNGGGHHHLKISKINKRLLLKLKKDQSWKQIGGSLSKTTPQRIVTPESGFFLAPLSNERVDSLAFIRAQKNPSDFCFQLLGKKLGGLRNLKKLKLLTLIIQQQKYSELDSLDSHFLFTGAILKKLSIQFYILLKLSLFSQRSIQKKLIYRAAAQIWKNCSKKALKISLIRINRLINKLYGRGYPIEDRVKRGGEILPLPDSFNQNLKTDTLPPSPNPIENAGAGEVGVITPLAPSEDGVKRETPRREVSRSSMGKKNWTAFFAQKKLNWVAVGGARGTSPLAPPPMAQPTLLVGCRKFLPQLASAKIDKIFPLLSNPKIISNKSLGGLFNLNSKTATPPTPSNPIEDGGAPPRCPIVDGESGGVKTGGVGARVRGSSTPKPSPPHKRGVGVTPPNPQKPKGKNWGAILFKSFFLGLGSRCRGVTPPQYPHPPPR